VDAAAVTADALAVNNSGTNSLSVPWDWVDLNTNALGGIRNFGGRATNEGVITLLSVPVAEGQSLAATLTGAGGAYGQVLDVFADYPALGALTIHEATSNRATVTNWTVDVNSGNVRFKFSAEPQMSHAVTGMVSYVYGGNSASVWDFSEGFEGAGFEESDWVETAGAGSVDEDDTQFAATGTQSLLLYGAATTYATTRTMDAAGDWAIAARVYITNAYEGNTKWLNGVDADGFVGPSVQRWSDREREGQGARGRSCSGDVAAANSLEVPFCIAHTYI
jgi:hypothetical protein